ncbi:hypothetical protein CC78DRAFT_529809 [Lojkania enalia]|uniref:NUC153 domain-containing protein n=1 Tax=Lojkania enalia TaxID=147567 RepID=A0A9P4KGR7_9PLEO|nr:hypothetical protein CC78DRAFT_529809 [Didymosphaeria enalia]
MPLPKRQVVPSKAKATKGRPRNDTRFANFETDPKFRLPSKRHAKTKLDSRFSRLLTDSDFYNKASVDRYGRKVAKHAGKKDVQKRFYQDSEGDEDEETEKKDKAVRKELARADKRGPNYDPIRDGGFSSSSDESSSDEEDDEEDEIEDQAELPTEESRVPVGDVTSRLAAVNMDWDNIRAADIMAVADSFVPASGRILSVVIYPSEFGRERLEREELEGPPREIFASSSGKNKNDLDTLEEPDESPDSEADDDQKKEDLLQDGNGEEFDSKALRAYQLDRLRYYYAVITCSSSAVAKSLYDNMDGREYLSSSNFFDLRFVPEDTTFDEDPHDECQRLSDAYKPNEFTTDALTHSKVKLTWDADDTTRKEAQKRAFSQREVDENDLQAYLGSDASSDEEGVDAKSSKAAVLRAALGLGSSGQLSRFNSGLSKRDRDFQKPEGEMQVTFSAGLSANAPKGSVFENEPISNETTIEKYVRKEKERRARRKERAKALREGGDYDAAVQEPLAKDQADEGDPWNDPFFNSDPETEKKAMKAQSKKSQKEKRREEREKAEKQSAAERAELELLMVDDEDSKVKHFDMNEIMKAEKAKKKGKKRRKDDSAPAAEDDFKMDVSDPRFAKLYESHEFAIDPTNPRFKGTSGMKALLEEGRKKRKGDVDGAEPETAMKRKRDRASVDADDIKKLAARVKAKSKKLVE